MGVGFIIGVLGGLLLAHAAYANIQYRGMMKIVEEEFPGPLFSVVTELLLELAQDGGDGGGGPTISRDQSVDPALDGGSTMRSAMKARIQELLVIGLLDGLKTLPLLSTDSFCYRITNIWEKFHENMLQIGKELLAPLIISAIVIERIGDPQLEGNDVEVMDTVTLWELERIVSKWQKMMSKIKRHDDLVSIHFHSILRFQFHQGRPQVPKRSVGQGC